MARPVTLFTGQWADLPLEKLAPLAKRWATTASSSPAGAIISTSMPPLAIARNTCTSKWELLERPRPDLLTRSRTTSSARRSATTSTSGTRRSCRPTSGATATRRRAQTRREADDRRPPRPRAPSSTRSPAAAPATEFPPSSTASPARRSGTRSTPSRRPRRSIGTRASHDFAKRFGADPRGVRQGGRQLRPRGAPDRDRLRHRDGAQRALAAVEGHKRFGFNYDPSHLGYQGVDYVKFIRALRRPHLPRAHEGRVVGPRRRQRRRLRRPHRTSAMPAGTGISARSATATSSSRTSSSR